MNPQNEPRRDGFTLIELLVVISIMGILISLILVAAADGVRRAEERATQSLITKLETALNDRLDALLNTQAPINQTHRLLAAINFSNPNANNVYMPVGSATSNSDDRRAQVIAQFDYIRAELPDVFFLNAGTKDGSTISASYPFNFAATPYPPGTNSAANFVLPLGNTSQGLPLDSTGSLVPSANSNYVPPPISGMFGASFGAAGGLAKSLGYAPQGYDGADNDGNGLIDDFGESGLSAIPAGLANHTHNTARSETLYAILVQGVGPLGSAFGPDDFTAREVADTDNDGLPEFVDAWGQPLQFYRWPIYYGSPTGPPIMGTSDSQMGYGQYNGPSQTRDQDPIDTNQLLVSPGWWSSAANPYLTFQSATVFSPPNGNSTNQSSDGAVGFMNYFHSLVEPNPGVSGGTGWDRGSSFSRREYFSKFLILSGGPDRQPGVAQLNLDYSTWMSGLSSSVFPNSGQTMEQNALALIYIENQAAVSDPVPSTTVRTGSFYETPQATGSQSPTSQYLQNSANADDITNHNISGPSTGVR